MSEQRHGAYWAHQRRQVADWDTPDAEELPATAAALVVSQEGATLLVVRAVDFYRDDMYREAV